MPESHPSEHQDDDHKDDEDVDEEIGDEGVQFNESMEYRVWSMDDTEGLEGWRAGLKAVQRCKSERSSCAKVQK
jgi:hypothetical protein